ncbi:MMPL family transporter [Pseudoxanthomonas dokdonensis]|nr:MMPL family transporter [Pseudoxanthomonas dokdonensis]
MSGASSGLGWRWLPALWLLLVLAVGWHQWKFWQAPRIDSNILAMLPQDADDRLLSDITARIADASARQVVVLLGAPTAAQALQAQRAFLADLDASDSPLQASGPDADWLAEAEALYTPHRRQLLTGAQRQRLEQTPPEVLAETSMAVLFSPVAGNRMTEWLDDPLALWPQWWQQRASVSGMRVGEDGLLLARDQHWAVLQFETPGPAFRLDGQPRIGQALDHAFAAAHKQAPTLTMLRAGVPLHAEAAASQANREINTIGWGSLAAVLLLVFLAFRSLRPILLVAMSLLLGCAIALSVTALVFGQVHLLTLIFGASLVGVAEDYGIHWFASRQSAPAQPRLRLMRSLLPGLLLALLTSSVAYLALGLPPFPGLRQMALFSVVGLAGAFLTVVCWFPWLDTGIARQTRFADVIGRSLARWPRIGSGRGWKIGIVAVLLLAVAGLAQLRFNDDLRSLQSSPPQLLREQADIGQLLGMPSPAQFYLVRGHSAEQVLQREEALTARLQTLQAEGKMGGYRAISDWLPSAQRQQSSLALSQRVEGQVIEQVAAALDEKLQAPARQVPPLDLPTWLQDPVSQPFRSLWLGTLEDDQGGQAMASVVMVDDLGEPGTLQQLAQLGDDLAGVRWVDRTADFSLLLGKYRHRMSLLLLLGVALVAAVLWWRYRRQAWRALLPTLLAMLLTVAALGWLGQPLQLFNVLALMLLLGMGIDYGIFLSEHRGDPSAWLAVCVGAASTWLSFGLLALSATPALRAFGLTLLLGIGLVWLLSPLLRPLSVQEAHTP